MDDKKVSRRNLLKSTLGIGGVAGLLASQSAFAAVCGLTPRQGEGPFYPQGGTDADSDLTTLEDGGTLRPRSSA